MNVSSSSFLWHKPIKIDHGSNPSKQLAEKSNSAKPSFPAAERKGDLTVNNADAEDLRAKAKDFEKVGEEFESLFVSMMLKEMRSTLDSENGGLFQGDSSDTLGGMFDLFMSQHMAEGESLGIAQAINRYMENSADNPQLNSRYDIESSKEGTDANSATKTLGDRIPIDIPPATRIETFG